MATWSSEVKDPTPGSLVRWKPSYETTKRETAMGCESKRLLLSCLGPNLIRMPSDCRVLSCLSVAALFGQTLA